MSRYLLTAVGYDIGLCVVLRPMSKLWLMLLPGFEWISLKGYLVGLAESYAYGWYFAVIRVSLYNMFSRRGGI